MVSIILPNYNHAPYLKERIDSILNQSYQDFELIILDDNSADNSREVIESYRDNSKVSQIIYNSKNSGSLFSQWNKGVDLAKGEYIWIAESDDVSHPLFLETVINNLLKDEDIVLSYCQSIEIDKDSKFQKDLIGVTDSFVNTKLFHSSFVMNGEEYTLKYFLNRNIILNTSAVVFRKGAYIKTGKASTEISYAGDWLMWLQMLTLGKVAYSHLRYNYYRRHHLSLVVQTLSNKKRNFSYKYDIIMRLAFLRYLRSVDGSNQLINDLKQYIASDALMEARYHLSRKEITKSVKYLGMAFKYSNSKSWFIRRLFNFISKK